MGRPCSICSSSKRTRIAAEMIAAGATDQAIADRIGGGISYMAVNRHRHNHVVAPAKALVEAAGKGRDAVQQRAQAMAAAEAGDPTAFVALAAIVTDLRKVHERLDRTATAAEQDNQRLAVSALSAQQLRAAEVRARMGGVGGYAPSRGADGGATAQMFAVNIHFSSGQVERIATVVQAGGSDLVEGEAPDFDDATSRPLDGPPELSSASDEGGLPSERQKALTRLVAAFRGGKGTV